MDGSLQRPSRCANGSVFVFVFVFVFLSCGRRPRGIVRRAINGWLDVVHGTNERTDDLCIYTRTSVVRIADPKKLHSHRSHRMPHVVYRASPPPPPAPVPMPPNIPCPSLPPTTCPSLLPTPSPSLPHSNLANQFQAGSFDAWGPSAPGYEDCRKLTGPAFESVFYKTLWAANAKMISYYMVYGCVFCSLPFLFCSC